MYNMVINFLLTCPSGPPPGMKARQLCAYYITLISGGYPLQVFAHFGGTEFIVWCLRCPNREMLMGLRIFFYLPHTNRDSCAAPTIKWPCATLIGGVSDKSHHKFLLSYKFYKLKNQFFFFKDIITRVPIINSA